MRPDILGTLPRLDGYRFRGAEDCPVVYNRGGDGTRIAAEQVRISVLQKSTDAERPVCYCFSHSVAEITDQVRATGTSTVLAKIKEQCANGLDACERRNPQGSCCLGNVQKVVKAAQASLAIPAHAEDVIETACDGCCAPAVPARHADTSGKPSRAGWFGSGAVFSAVPASWVITLPVAAALAAVSYHLLHRLPS